MKEVLTRRKLGREKTREKKEKARNRKERTRRNRDKGTGGH